ncbi:MAG: hypothetical protein QXT73_01255 [Candidatus Methanomethylicaceae archaeon]
MDGKMLAGIWLEMIRSARRKLHGAGDPHIPVTFRPPQRLWKAFIKATVKDKDVSDLLTYPIVEIDTNNSLWIGFRFKTLGTMDYLDVRLDFSGRSYKELYEIHRCITRIVAWYEKMIEVKERVTEKIKREQAHKIETLKALESQAELSSMSERR